MTGQDGPKREEQPQERPEPRQSTREERPSTRYSSDECVTLEGGAQSFGEAMEDSHGAEWKRAVQEERLRAIHESV